MTEIEVENMYAKVRKHSLVTALTVILCSFSIGVIVFFAIKGTASKPKVTLKSKYEITHRTCAGKLRGTYPNCTNIRNKEGFICFDIIDSTSDVIGFMIIGGIIKVKIKKGE